MDTTIYWTFEFNGIEMDRSDFKERLKDRLASVNTGMVRRDVMPFLKNSEATAIWSNDYFLQLADRIRFL
jgi:hypothetical protein